ncbi:hypothetical protein AADG42_03150 [Ammonicoccus fulvus]|uniref:Uncharacterized protein n=1 Tax=Ammonicoccus fulvus TaxID=3138240 RepID=A0ABZ3FJY3_9ACTN
MPRIAAGLAGLALLTTLAACGTTPGATPTQTPTEAPPTVAATTPAATATAESTATADESATPDATATANTTATAGTTATATASATATAQAVALPARVETFTRVEQRSENDTQIGSYYSDTLKTVLEARMARGKSANELITSVGGTSPTSVNGAMCSTAGDTICARESNGVAVVVASKELPAGMVADLTDKFLAG